MDSEGKEGQVTIQISRQEEALEALSSTIDELEKLLSTLLLACPGIKDLGEPEQELVAMAIRIRTNLHRIEEQDARLKDIIARLEI